MTLKLQVLGPGCPRCKLLADFAATAARELALEYSLEKITDLNQIMALGVVGTPVLVVNGVVNLVGKVPGIPELKAILKQATQERVCQSNRPEREPT
jgi:small redox-active disulfide protein 2